MWAPLVSQILPHSSHTGLLLVLIDPPRYAPASGPLYLLFSLPPDTCMIIHLPPSALFLNTPF